MHSGSDRDASCALSAIERKSITSGRLQLKKYRILKNRWMRTTCRNVLLTYCGRGYESERTDREESDATSSQRTTLESILAFLSLTSLQRFSVASEEVAVWRYKNSENLDSYVLSEVMIV